MTNKFTPIKFPLKMRGIDVRNLEDLRENFDLNAAVAYFKDGKLIKWLEARYYDDEAEKISSLNENVPDFREKLCAALGVEFAGDDSARVEEKKNRLRELTDDESIIDNAATTALNQEDLAELLDAGTRTIYLCGKIFTVPIRVRDKKYIGVLGTPEIKIRANSQAELDAQNISFVNVILPWDIADVADAAEKVYRPVSATANDSLEQLKELYKSNFATGSKKVCKVWSFVDGNGNQARKVLNDEKKKVALHMLCENRYAEDEIIHVCLDKDLSNGWAFTKDSFVFNRGGGTVVIPYKDFLFMGFEVGRQLFSYGDEITILYKSGSEIVTTKIPSTGAFNKYVMCNVNKYLKETQRLS